MDDGNDVIQEDRNQPSDLTREARRPKNKIKNAGKKVASNIKDAFKEGAKGIWQAFSPKIKLIVAGVIGVIVFLACVYIVYADFFISSSEETISDYYSNSESASEAAKSLYNSTGSLLLSSNTDTKNIANEFLINVKPRNITLYDFMSKKYKNGDPDNSGVPLKESFFFDDALNINASRTLYEHLINAERYNFNKIRWIKYDRDKNKGLVPLSEMSVEPESQLQYPKDSDNTSFKTLSNMVRPYLQSWIIPYGLFSGLLSEGTGDSDKIDYGQFAYQLLIEGYHKIIMNQYNLKVLTVNTTQNVYDILEYTVKRTCSRDSEGNEKVTTTHIINSSGKAYKVLESCKPGMVVEVSRVPSKYVVYKLEKAETFDRVFENTYTVHLYNEATDTPEHYITREPYITGKELTQAELNNLSNLVFSNQLEYLEYTMGLSNSWSGTYTYKFNKGYTQNETKIWKDKLETISETDRVLRVLDVEEYINDFEPPKTERVELSSQEKDYYEYLAVEETEGYVRLTRMDLVNAKREIYTNYLKRGANYSDNIGYPRSWLTFSLDALKDHVKAIEESDTGWKYLYGDSLGLEIKIPKTTSTSVEGDYVVLQDYDATGVVKAMQEVYDEYGLKNRHGTTYQAVKFYPENAEYAWTTWKDYVTEVCADYGVDPLFVLAKMCIESSGGKYSGWGTGPAAGPMQIEKSVHLGNTMSAYNVKTGKTDKIVMTRENLSNDKTNIRIGIMYYANKLKECSGNPYLAAQKYNYGNIGFVNDYAKRVNKDKNAIIADLNDVGWVYESMNYHNRVKAGDGYYAYKFAYYLEYLKKK